MRIAVCIKQVPDTKSVKMDPETGTVVRKGVQSIVNPLDLYALETALQMKETYGAETIAVSMGPPQAIEAVKEAIAMGIDGGALISDRAFAGSDTWATAYILAAAIKQLGPFDLIICGERATDGDTGQIGPEIAAELGLPTVTYVNKLIDSGKDEVTVSRLVENGAEEVAMDLPGVLTVVKEVGEPRLPTLRGKLKAKATDITKMALKDLELNTSYIGLKGSPTRVVKIFQPKVVRECRKVYAENDGMVEEAVDQLINFLKSKKVLAS
ncbi:MAG: electron transfer flavoprotein subunit beta/FixA family protein [Lentisphaerae bacterium]|nr:electron transfer flavoprotein subunit beta/FixA family protein [Lentisphaerota bacterium]MCP4101123.1 electron transfer flavoprotein subunit beta/FixA family protein [Lentisphaerota bacterium]